MRKLFWLVLLQSTGLIFFLFHGLLGSAAETTQVFHQPATAVNPTTSLQPHYLSQAINSERVVQLSDPNFQALQSLIEHYNCPVVHPHLRSVSRTMTRYEFAVSLNACIYHINELAASDAVTVTQEDLVMFQHLQKNFSAELATLRSRPDGLKLRPEALDASQFSTNRSKCDRW